METYITSRSRMRLYAHQHDDALLFRILMIFVQGRLWSCGRRSRSFGRTMKWKFFGEFIPWTKSYTARTGGSHKWEDTHFCTSHVTGMAWNIAEQLNSSMHVLNIWRNLSLLFFAAAYRSWHHLKCLSANITASIKRTKLRGEEQRAEEKAVMSVYHPYSSSKLNISNFHCQCEC